MSEKQKEILEEAVFSLEVEGFEVTETEKQIVSEMLEGKRTLQDIISEYVIKGKSYARI
jgi:hypothetical protein